MVLEKIETYAAVFGSLTVGVLLLGYCASSQQREPEPVKERPGCVLLGDSQCLEEYKERIAAAPPPPPRPRISAPAYAHPTFAPPPSSYTQPTEETRRTLACWLFLRGAAEELQRTHLRALEKVRFENAYAVQGPRSLVACGTVKGLNRDGGWSGPHRFVAIDAAASMIETGSNSSVFQATWSLTCAKMPRAC